jgi:hypothetical protein
MGIGNNGSKVGRNDPCHCGSGKKYKKCCLPKDRTISADQKTVDKHNTDSKQNKIKDNPTQAKMNEKVQSLEGLEDLNSPTSQFLKILGVNEELLSEFSSEYTKLREYNDKWLDVPDKFNKHFANLGWVAYNRIDAHVMKKAVEMAELGNLDLAEQILVDYYDLNLDFMIRRLEWIEEFEPRMELIKKTYEDYSVKRYHSCIPVVLAIIDGVVCDNKDTGNKCFFGEGNDLVLDDSLVGHFSGLPTIQKVLSQPRSKTTTEKITIPYRNGILHGRDLGYANKIVAVKAWATLITLSDWIVDMKKSKEPHEEVKEANFWETHELNQKRENLRKNWKPRNLEIGISFPESGNSSEYEEGSPEKVLIEFLENWSKNKYGLMVEKLDYMFVDGRSVNNIAGELRRDFFKGKILLGFKILKIIDEMIKTKIKIDLQISKETKKFSSIIEFWMIYEDNTGEADIRGMPKLSWKIMKGLYEIQDI